MAAAAGIAGAYATSRSDVSDSLPGAAVAIALVPPLVVTGTMWQAGEWEAGNGSLLLFATNAVAILVLGGLTFVATGTAPLRRVADSQQRMRSSLGAVGVLGVLVMGGLALNGAEITASGFERSTAEQAVDDWVGDDTDLLVDTVVVDEDLVTVVVTGPPTTLDADGLAASLADRLGREITLDLRQQLQEHTVVDSG